MRLWSKKRLERALDSKTRIAEEQLEIQPGDLVDFWRKPATKDESGWRGPATVVEPRTPGSTPQGVASSVRWQGRTLSVRTQDLRRALVYTALLLFPSWGDNSQACEDLVSRIIAFADGLMQGQVVRVGWIRVDSRHDDNSRVPPCTPVRARVAGVGPVKKEWLRSKESSNHSELSPAIL